MRVNEWSLAKRFAFVAGLTAATAAVPFVAARVMVQERSLEQVTQSIMAQQAQGGFVVDEDVARMGAQRQMKEGRENLRLVEIYSSELFGLAGLAIGLALTGRRKGELNDKPQP